MKYIVYQTTNLINNKIYIGVHMTENPDIWDFYLGDGCFANKPSSYLNKTQPFPKALTKYGVNNFKRDVLRIFDTEQEALKLEALIVNEDFIKRKDTYNITLGGGKPPINYDIVYQYDLNGNLIKSWESVKSIIDFYNCHKDQIGDCVREKRSFQNSFWSKEKYSILDITQYRLTEYTTKVKVYDKNRNFLNCFNSLSEAGNFYNEDPQLISGAIREKHLLHNKYYINYYEDISILDRQLNYTNTTKVYQYNKNTGEFIKEYNSVKEAALDVGYKTHSGLIKAIKENKIAKNYRWSYSKVDNILKETIQIEIPNKPKQIEQLDLNGNTIKIWDIAECRKQYPNCIKVCRGVREKAYGYRWKYIS